MSIQDTNESKKFLGHEFRKMEQADFEGLAGAEDGTLICELDDEILLLTPQGTLVVIDSDGYEKEWAIVQQYGSKFSSFGT